jgi:hypothetical protein
MGQAKPTEQGQALLGLCRMNRFGTIFTNLTRDMKAQFLQA